MIIETKFDYCLIQDNPHKVKKLFIDKIIDAGYLKSDGEVVREKDRYSLDIIFKYYPGRKDILYKRFDWWKPEWMREKEIKFRRFV